MEAYYGASFLHTLTAGILADNLLIYSISITFFIPHEQTLDTVE